MDKKMDYGRRLNIRIANDLIQAIGDCADELGERRSVFVRKALVNRLLEEGVLDLTDEIVNPWINSDRDLRRKRKEEKEARKAGMQPLNN